MKKTKNTAFVALFVLLLVFTCLFAACEDAPDAGEDTTAEIAESLDDFVYDTEIDRDHVITERELAAMNRLWLSEFGKKFAETPDEAMKRQEDGDFYFGRYGRTFVFYRKQYNMEMEFAWGSHNFVFPWGEFYFLNGEKVYTREEIVLTSLFTEAHIDAFYNCYKNTYLNYVSTVTLPEGEYVLTQEELDSINLAYARKNGFKDTYKLYDTLEVAMQRKKDYAYYFGKFGDTAIIWSIQHYSEKKGFTLGGYDFDFYSGGVLFFDPKGIYNQTEVQTANILTDDEIKAFYDHYTEYYLPLNTDPYIILEFTDGLEKLTDAEMRSINAAYDEWKYEQVYRDYYDMYIDAKYSEQKAHESADRAAHSMIGYDSHRFFNEENFETYRYYGKRGGKIFLADGDVYSSLHVFEIAGYKFVIDGGAEEIIVVSEDGKITELAEAYESGLVSKDDVAFAHERHLAYSEYSQGDMEEIAPPARLKIGTSNANSPIALTEEKQREIVWEYIAGSREEELKYPYGVRCYGKFGETYAVMIDGPFMYTQAERRESVAGYTFIFNNGQQMYIYKEGVFYSLRKAYELGVVTEENIASIEWSKIAPYTYTKTTAPLELTEEEIKRILRSYMEFGASHKKDAVYSIRFYGKNDIGYAVFIDCSDKSYNNVRTVEKVGEYEFIYPTEQTLMFICSGSTKMSLPETLEYKMIDETALKAIYETYRAAHSELYK